MSKYSPIVYKSVSDYNGPQTVFTTFLTPNISMAQNPHFTTEEMRVQGSQPQSSLGTVPFPEVTS